MEQLEFTAAAGDTGRLDAWLAAQCPALSRSALQNLIEQGCVTKGAAPVNKKEKVVPGAVYTVELPDPQPIEARPQNIPLDIVYEDDDLLVVNKPKGMVVHPATRTARWSMRCSTTARDSCPALAGPSARASSTVSIRTPAAFWSLPKTMRHTRPLASR